MQAEQLTCDVKEDKFDDVREECEFHIYETRFDSRGESNCLRAGTKIDIDPPRRRSDQACLVLNRDHNTNGELFRTYLKIQSRYIINALREVIVTYPGVDFASKPIILHEPPRCLFHYRDELREYAESSNSEKLKSHIRLCCEYMEKTLHNEINLLNSIEVSHWRALNLKHRHLWLIFKPGLLLYQKSNTIEEGLVRLVSISGHKDENNQIRSWEICFVFTGWNGSRIGQWMDTVEILCYDGCKSIQSLSIVPLCFFLEEQRIRHDALERGRKIISLRIEVEEAMMYE